jgi:hypothetical protein
MPHKTRWISELDEIKRLGALGLRMPQLAERYGVSKQRIKQILDKYIPEWDQKYGAAVNRQARADVRYAKWGVQEDNELYASKRRKFYSKKANAEHTGWEWSVEFGSITWPTHCPILGMELDYFAESRQENSVSFDRIDSTKGYINGNVQIVSWRANRIKNDGTAEEHRKIAEYLDSLITRRERS